MKAIKKVGAQGDVFFLRVRSIPKTAKPVEATSGRHLVAHSETGHHHWIAADGRVERFEVDPFTCYLRVDAAFADVVHARPFDTHETVRLPCKDLEHGGHHAPRLREEKSKRSDDVSEGQEAG